MAQDASAPATKTDLGSLKQELKTDIASLKQEFKTDIASLKKELKTDIGLLEIKFEQWKEEVKEHFNIVAENLRYDLVGIYKDRTEDHEQRIRRLERKTGLAA